MLDACEFRLESELDDALAILAAVSLDSGSDGGRVGVDELDAAVGMSPERGR